MESGQHKRRLKKHQSSSHSNRKNAATFFRFASCTPLKLDDVKTRGKEMAKIATQSHHQTSSFLVGSHVPKSRSAKVSSAGRASTANHDAEVRPARGPSPAKLPKKLEHKNPNVKELTRELPSKAKKPKVRLSNADHPVRRGKPKIIDGIFQQGRQRPTGPVRTFIVFKASSKHNQMRRRKPKRRLRKLPGQRRFSPLPVYNPIFYKKSELKRGKFPKLRLSDKIHIQPAKPDGGAPNVTLPSGAAKATSAVTSATSHQFAVPTSVDAERGGTKKVAPRELSAGPKVAPKTVSVARETGLEKKVHTGSGHQVKLKKKRHSISTLQKKPVRRRSRMYQPAKGKSAKRRTQSKSRRGKKPVALALSRKSLLAILRPGLESGLKKRITTLQRMKRLEKAEEAAREG